MGLSPARHSSIASRLFDRAFKMRLVAFGIAGLGVPVALLVTGLAANAVYLAVTAVAG